MREKLGSVAVGEEICVVGVSTAVCRVRAHCLVIIFRVAPRIDGVGGLHCCSIETIHALVVKIYRVSRPVCVIDCDLHPIPVFVLLEFGADRLGRIILVAPILLDFDEILLFDEHLIDGG